MQKFVFGNKLSNSLLYVSLVLVTLHTIAMTSVFAFGVDSHNILVRAVNLDKECNIPVVYQCFAILTSAVILGMVAFVKKKKNDIYFINWQIMSAVFALLAVDEAVRIHEKISKILTVMLNHPSGFLHYPWIIVGVIFVLTFIAINTKMLINLGSATRNQLILAGFIYVSGAVGLEAVGGFYSSRFTEFDAFYYTLVVFEEFLEMLGVIYFINTLLDYLKSEIKNVNLESYPKIFKKLSNRFKLINLSETKYERLKNKVALF